ncbi:MAG: DUF2298 domain-containing protein, partial [Anaerolineaceae bacterium]|nr:DUF2298 domain-containing protein [Anaerolineaceae bacterium]
MRVPERYPLTTEYYRSLLGCPEDKGIIWCYSVAEPGMFEGNLGFDLIRISQSDPNLGPIKFNSQFAEEAFTVYDHPKVLIFQKTEQYQSAQVREVLGDVDLTNVIHLTPGEASNYIGNLTLPVDRLSEQRKGGTWSDLFDRGNLLNGKPFVGLIVWYLTICILGWIMYPITRIAFRGLSRKGYPLARLFGLIVLAWIVWISGSAGIPFTKFTISIAVALLLGINLILFLVNRVEIIRELKVNWKYYLFVELFLLVVFSIGVLIRLGNPDLWHPAKGGEKPMDFSYLNAVLKSTTFPPYDPWYAGGYINYYYYGFVLVGVLVKWLGIIPSIADNYILPTLLMLLAAGTFTVGWNLADAAVIIKKRSDQLSNNPYVPISNRVKALAGMATTSLMIFLGNLGTTRMIWHGLMKSASPEGIDGSNIFQRVSWTIQGIEKLISGTTLPYGPGDWYWIPSRAFPNEPITEFPFFTFLYADLHAHLIALPITVLVICWVISILRGKWQWEKIKGKFSILSPIITFLAGALIIGALKPTNTWDYPTYLILGSITLFYVVIRYANPGGEELSFNSTLWRKIILAFASVGILIGLSMILYEPFTKWYGQGYGAVKIWDQDHTPFWSYFTHWGLFLFLIFSWMIWETRDWMARTPVSALNKLRPYRGVIQGILILLVVAIIGLLILGVNIAWLVLSLAIWSALLIIRPGQSDLKRAVLFFTGTALVLSLTV